MVKIDPTVSTLSAAGALAIAISIMLNWVASSLGQQTMALAGGAAQAADAPAVRSVWAASSTGRVEPRDGEVRITAQVPGRIVEVIAKTNEKVSAGDILVRLDDADLWAKLEAAESEAAVRMRERDEEPAAKGPAVDRRNAEDNVHDAERALFKAHLSLDDAVRAGREGRASAENVNAARERLTAAKAKADNARDGLTKLNGQADMPLPTRLESSVQVARTDVELVETAIDRTRLRAPADGTVLNVWAKAGEMASPSPEAPLVLFGDLTGLRVRAEVEERDVVKIHVGQRVVVRADAYPDKDFEGVVTSLAPALGPPRIVSRGPRRPNDVEVLEVLASLDGPPPLLTGMRVDVFFKLDSTAEGPAKTN